MNADVYALCEIQKGDSAPQMLVDALNKEVKKERFAYVSQGWSNGDTLSCGYVYRTDRVRPYGDLQYAYRDTNNLYHCRLVACGFEELSSGERFVLNINHLRSKRGMSEESNSKRMVNVDSLLVMLDKIEKEQVFGDTDVLLEYGGNDSDYNWQEIAEAPEKEHFPRTRLEVFEQVYERVINKIKEMGAIPLVLSLPPMDAERYFAFFSQKWEDGFRANVMRWLGGSTNTIMSGHELYNLATMRIAQRTGAQWIDVTSELLKEHNFRAYLCDDGIHPNEQGQRKMAEVILAAMR